MDAKTHRYYILAASILPPVGLVVATVLLWNQAVSVRDLAILAGFYALCALGVTVGFHRLLTHRAFKTKKPVRLALTTLGTMSAEGPPIIWVSHHRKHHALADHEGDPHSPHLDVEPGLRGVLKALWHAHWGWLFKQELTSDPMRYAPDLVREKEMRWISQHFLSIAAMGVLLPGLVGLAIGGTLAAFLTGALWGGLVRIFLIHHATYSINSICHYFGRRRYGTDDESRNVSWLAVASLGESWHNNHHAFPTSYRHGLRWYEVDFSAMFIRLLERMRLAWDVVRVSPDRERSKRIGAEPVAAGVSAAGDAPTLDADRARDGGRDRELVP
jgi:stearoyl-CoA desaturase (delta-9 desaturase)